VIDTADKFRNRVLEVTKEHDEYYLDVDGFYYYWPRGYPYGHSNSAALRIIADELDRINKPWQDEVDKYFASVTTPKGP